MNSSFPTPPPMCVLHVQVGRTLSNVPLPHCVPFWELGPGTGAPVHQKHADTKGGLGGCLPDPGRPFQGRAHIQTRFSLLWGTLLSAKGMFPGHGELSGPAAQRGHESRERERDWSDFLYRVNSKGRSAFSGPLSIVGWEAAGGKHPSGLPLQNVVPREGLRNDLEGTCPPGHCL